MPLGGFLDTLPSALFVAAHLAFLVVGIWAIRQLSRSGAAQAPALVLYAAAQVVFLAVFGGALTLKMGVLIEQTLVVVMVIWLTIRAASSRSEAVR